ALDFILEFAISNVNALTPLLRESIDHFVQGFTHLITLSSRTPFLIVPDARKNVCRPLRSTAYKSGLGSLPICRLRPGEYPVDEDQKQMLLAIRHPRHRIAVPSCWHASIPSACPRRGVRVRGHIRQELWRQQAIRLEPFAGEPGTQLQIHLQNERSTACI